MQDIQNSIREFQRAKNVIPGGVNSPVRAFKQVGGTPRFFHRAKGAYLYDIDDNAYIDYINSWGPMIVGHSHPTVVEEIKNQVDKAISFGAPTIIETLLAEKITSLCPNVDKVRFVSSGTEACMSALRLARGYTGKNKFIKFNGCYHGHADPFLIKAGSGVATFGIATVPGVPEGVAQDTLIAEFNDLAGVQALFDEHGSDMAAIILEPVAGNMGCILPEKGFLEGLRKLCTDHGSVLIFDEVMTGFRLGLGGAQERLQIDADLVTYGKVVGGGMPVGAFGGKAEIMNHIAPDGQVYQAGTLSGNPVSMTAGLTTLTLLEEMGKPAYDALAAISEQLRREMTDIFAKKGIPVTINNLGSMISVHFTENAVNDFGSSAASDGDRFNAFFHHMLEQGIYLPPSKYESWFFATCLGSEEVEKTVAAVKKFEI